MVKKYNLHLIEDCAHAIEAKYQNKHLGTFGTFGCFSFYATKNLSIGEGGMLITDNKKLYERARVLSLHGMDKAAWNRYGKRGYRHYDVSEVGYKYNLMDLLSAIGVEQFKKIQNEPDNKIQYLDVAINHFTNAATIKPSDSNTYTTLAKCHLDKGDEIAAKNAVITAVTLSIFSGCPSPVL